MGLAPYVVSSNVNFPRTFFSATARFDLRLFPEVRSRFLLPVGSVATLHNNSFPGGSSFPACSPLLLYRLPSALFFFIRISLPYGIAVGVLGLTNIPPRAPLPPPGSPLPHSLRLSFHVASRDLAGPELWSPLKDTAACPPFHYPFSLLRTVLLRRGSVVCSKSSLFLPGLKFFWRSPLPNLRVWRAVSFHYVRASFLTVPTSSRLTARS